MSIYFKIVSVIGIYLNYSIKVRAKVQVCHTPCSLDQNITNDHMTTEGAFPYVIAKNLPEIPTISQ